MFSKISYLVTPYSRPRTEEDILKVRNLGFPVHMEIIPTVRA